MSSDKSTLKVRHPGDSSVHVEDSMHYLDQSKLLVRQGQQLWHLHKMLSEFREEVVIAELGATYVAVGRVATPAEGIVLAASAISIYRSAECGERVMQRTRERLKGQNNELPAPANPTLI